MGPLDALWHLLNFVAPAFGLGAIAAGFCKLIWRAELAHVSWRRLSAWACAASLAALMGGLIISGRDGRMSTYALMVLACAAALAWAGFGRAPR